MRQPQHRTRARARARRQPNPVNRVYESNGPDVKVRGTPQQVAEKYMQLGRDALSSGDDVKAENYFQHAEHYLRIIAAAQEQQQARRQQQQQRRQEAMERRRGDGDEQPSAASADATTVEAAGEAAEQAGPVGRTNRNKGNGGDWGDRPPQFLATPTDAGADVPDDAGSFAEEVTKSIGSNEGAQRATTVRHTTSGRKGNGADTSDSAPMEDDAGDPARPAQGD